ncbi:hypothetical protein D3C72_2393430 [compost metagenome]
MHEITKDSVRNCATNSFLFAPTTFLTPTSFALFSLWAVLKFMKLMQAIIRIKQAMAINDLTMPIRCELGFPCSVKLL